ncbi:hypothetical protein QJQ45_017754, partial [Haematococcus lacustris]
KPRRLNELAVGPSGSSPAAGPFGSSPAADPYDSSSSNKRQPADIGSGLADERAFQFDTATQMGMGLDPGAIQAVSAASGVWDEDGCLDSFIRSKLTWSQVQHDSGLIQARHITQRWNDNIKLELQHLAAATPAGTSLVAIQRHVAVTLATWDAVWEEYLHPKWAEQKMRLYGAQEKVLERYFKKLEDEAAIESQKRWGTRKQLVVFFGNAGIGTRGGWGAKAVLQACRKVVERANGGKPTDRVPGKVVTVDEFRTSRVSSAMDSPQPCEAELDRSKPPGLKAGSPSQVRCKNRLLRSAWSQRFVAPVRGLMWCPQLHQATPGDLGKWVDRDCNAALNLQRAGESKWRPLELCRWEHRGRLPDKGKEYRALGFKKLRDRAPMALAQQPRDMPHTINSAYDLAFELEVLRELLSSRQRRFSHYSELDAVQATEAWQKERLIGTTTPALLVRLLKHVDPSLIAHHGYCSFFFQTLECLQEVRNDFVKEVLKGSEDQPDFSNLVAAFMIMAVGAAYVACAGWPAGSMSSEEKYITYTRQATCGQACRHDGDAQGKSKAAKAKPAPQPGRWLDRDCNAALNMQRIGESRWHPLELCRWLEQAALPAKGKEYPGLGYKRVRHRPHKAQQQQQQQPVGAQLCVPPHLSCHHPSCSAYKQGGRPPATYGLDDWTISGPILKTIPQSHALNTQY